jgi:soluble lytic murein transglycosylase-like protein
MLGNLRYFCRLVGSLQWAPRPRPRTVAAGLVLATMSASAAVYGGNAATAGFGTAGVEALLSRAQQLNALLDRTEMVYDDAVAPIERVLLQYRADDPQLTRRVAVSLVREARRTGLEPRLLLAVLLVENPWINPDARSPVGATGLMQVMPLHRGQWPQCAPRLDDVDANICHGAHIFAAYLHKERGNIDRALLRYNGCVNGTNTPNCHQYPNHVYARAGRASVLAWGTGTPGASR